MGLPCFHTISERLEGGGYILPEDILLFWWYNRSKWEDSLLQECRETRTILEPLVVRGKGRPKGQKGSKKAMGHQVWFNTNPKFYHIIPILHFRHSAIPFSICIGPYIYPLLSLDCSVQRALPTLTSQGHCPSVYISERSLKLMMMKKPTVAILTTHDVPIMPNEIGSRGGGGGEERNW